MLKKLKHKIGNKIRILLKPIDILYTKRCRKRIKNSNFTILCNSCIGGSIYHRLGLKFLTPTINLSMSSADFIKFLNNIDFYLNQTFIEVKSDKKWPCALLKDINVNFVHYKTFEEGVECWNRRVKRINFDNLYIIIRDIHTNYLSENDIKKNKNKI